MSSTDPGVAALLQVALAQIQATAAAALADVPARLARAQKEATAPQELALLEAARQHVVQHRDRLAQDFGQALRARVQGDAQASGAQPANPLRAAVIGWAMNRAIQKLTPDAQVARLLARHAGFGLSTAMADCRRRIVDDLQQRGIASAASLAEAAEGDDRPEDANASVGVGVCAAVGAEGSDGSDTVRQREQAALLDRLMRGETPSDWAPLLLGADPVPDGDPLSDHGGDHSDDNSDDRYPVSYSDSEWGSDVEGDVESGFASDSDQRLTQVLRALNDSGFDPTQSAPLPPPENLIRRHRVALEQAATGPLDRLVIGIASDLFDAVVADPQVPPPVASMLAPLQLPMLRVALRDPGFFASGQHPVRRFVDRVASLGQARTDLDSDIGRGWLARVGGLVQQIVQGDFHQKRLYDRQLRALDRITAETAKAEVDAGPVAATLRLKEAEWHADRQRLRAAGARVRSVLAPLPLPPFLMDFLAVPWSLVVVGSCNGDGAGQLRDQPCTPGLRLLAADLVVSVLQKRTQEERRGFAAALPGLMSGLHQGLDRIDWPVPQRRAFFDQLMTVHAASMRGTGVSASREPDAQLEPDLVLQALELRRQTARAFERPASAVAPCGSETDDGHAKRDNRLLHDPYLEPRFTADEARRVGLVGENDVSWADPQAGKIAAPPLRERLQLGLSYRLLLHAQWQPIRLTYLAPGRNFFMFSHGAKQRQSISMTARMVDRLCASARMLSGESAPLLDRATEKLRQRMPPLPQHAA